MKQYLDLLRNIIDNGHSHPDRTGTGRKSIFGTQMRFDLSKGKFPLLTTKKVFTKGFIAELLWFIKGDTNNANLNKDGVNIWNSWAVKDEDINDFFNNYAYPQARKEHEAEGLTGDELQAAIVKDMQFHKPEFVRAFLNSIGPLYGAMWRNAPGSNENIIRDRIPLSEMPSDKLEQYKKDYLLLIDPNGDLDGSDFLEYAREEYYKTIDQLQNLLLNLKKRPYSARHIVNAYIPQFVPFEDISPQENVMIGRGALSACHAMFQCFVHPPVKVDGVEVTGKKRLSLQMYQRSVDTPIGLPFNIAQYALLTFMLAHVSDMEPFEFIWVGGDTHIYSNQIELVEEQIKREPLELPILWLNPEVKDIYKFTLDDIKIENYQHLEAIKYPVSM